MVVALGATGLRGLTGKSPSITSTRGKQLPLADGGILVVTVHPSYLLRIEDERDKAAEYRRFVADLRLCAQTLRVAA